MKFQKTTLKSGLRVVTIPLKDSLSTTTMILVETGSNYETSRQNGLSHFLEHMVFKGTKKRLTSQEIALDLDSLGAYNNAFTSTEMTGYFAKAESKHFKKILEILSDMYVGATFPEKDLEIERGVILEEIGMYDDDPRSEAVVEFMRLMYGDTPAGRPTIGTRENVKRFTRKDFVTYRDKHYTAEKTIVVVAGNISHAEVVSEVRKSFKNLRNNSLPNGKPKVVEKQKRPGLRIKKKASNQAHLIFGLRAFSAKDKRASALLLLATILGQGMSSRLWKKMREELGACYYVTASAELESDHGLLAVPAGVSASRVKEVVQEILKVFKELRDHPVSPEELNKSKEYLVGKLFRRVETSSDLAEYYGTALVVEGQLKTPQEIEKEIRRVGAEEIQRLAQEIFQDKNLNLALVGDVSQEEELRQVLNFK